MVMKLDNSAMKRPYNKSIEYPQKARGMSFFAFIFSIFIYISIFYIFDLSPSTLFNNTKFWFLISNTLILIIAVDYGSFSSSSIGKGDVYEEYVMHRQAARSSTTAAPTSFVLQDNPETVKKSIIHKQEDHGQAEFSIQEKKVTCAPNIDQNPENILQIVAKKNDQEKPSENFQEERIIHEVEGGRKASEGSNYKTEATSYRRSRSEAAKKAVINDSKNILRRSVTEKLKENEESVEVNNNNNNNNNEFSSMSDEELNRRVEEFIQNFNRQIRLQAARNFQHV